MPEPISPGEDDARKQAPAARRGRRRLSWIWLVPVVAALAGIALVVRSILEAGPTVTITFLTAEGLEAGKTQIRYKDFNVGLVQSIRLNEDRSKVIVTAGIAKDAASLASADSRFWVVRPRLGLSGVSGLGTLLSGAYIGVDAPDGNATDGKLVPAARQTEFVGLEAPPEVKHDRPGKRFTLKAGNLGSLDVGSPVYYRRITVGEVVGYHLDGDGQGVEVQVFVDAPHDKYVTQGVRFWNASGIDFTVSAQGLTLRTQSLLSMALGGIAFETLGAEEQPVAQDEASFTLYADEVAARAVPDGEPLAIRMRFDQSVRGLVVGAPIDFNGVLLGQVESITMDFDDETKRFFAVVQATLYPQRLGRVFETVREYAGPDLQRPSGRLLTAMVARGLRAQLRTGSLLTGQLYVALDVFPDAAPVQFKMEMPANIPTVPGNLDQLQQQLTRIVDKIEKLPLDKLSADLRTALAGASRLMTRLDKQVAPEAQAMLRQASKSLADIGSLIAPDSAVPVNSARAMQELSRAAQSLRALSDYLQANPEALLQGRKPDLSPGAGLVRTDARGGGGR